MAKRGRKPKPVPTPKPATRSSFLPDEPTQVIEQRQAEQEIEVDLFASIQKPLTVTRLEDRRVEVRLELPPLRACVEVLMDPLKASPEQIISTIAASVERLGNEAKEDGINQHARKRAEEEAARQRYEARPTGING